jgi:hypothetical protein
MNPDLLHNTGTPLLPPGAGGWRRRIVVAVFLVACLTTLIALFYAEENWRGKKSWERCRAELEKEGAVFNWDAFIPPAMPDDQNVFKAPNMQEWFVKGAGNELGQRLARETETFLKANTRTGLVQLAELQVRTPSSTVDVAGADMVVRLGANAPLDQLRAAAEKALGASVDGAQGWTLTARPLHALQPSRIVIEAGRMPTIQELEALFPKKLTGPAGSSLHVELGYTNDFYLLMTAPPSTFAAAEYLQWSDKLGADFDLIRSALRRPYARMEGDYQQPFALPTPNFIAIRCVAQTLGQRAQCYLLLGQPDRALRELTLLHAFRRLLEAEPSHRPITLVAAMIDAALVGLFTGVVGDGLRLGAWRGAQLAVLQRQLAEIDLLPYLAESIAEERAGVCRLFETSGPSALNRVFSFGVENPSLWDKIKHPQWMLLLCMPRGWVYQNMRAIAVLDQKVMAALDLTNHVISPSLTGKAEKATEAVALAGEFSAHTFLAAVAMPNFTKAIQNLARNQTMVHLAAVACALERCRLAHGDYPESLEALIPEFCATLPRDIIGGGPLEYRKTGAASFLLYSVGWNGRDDGGKTEGHVTDGDWVWQN